MDIVDLVNNQNSMSKKIHDAVCSIINRNKLLL